MSGTGEAQGVSVTYRSGCNDDAASLVRLLDLATQGASLRAWKTMMTETDKNPFEAGARLICEPGHPWAPDRAVIADADGQIAGAAYAFPIREPEAEIDISKIPPEDVPYIRLQHSAGNAIYIENISVFPEYQGKGVGSALLNVVLNAGEIVAGASNVVIERAALIVNDDNHPARRFYEERGFSYLASADVPPGTYYPEGKSVHLMVRPFESRNVS